MNFFGTLLRPKNAEADNPWCASTLEWSLPSPAPAENFGLQSPVIYRGAYEFAENLAEGFAPQHLAPELLLQKVR